MLAERLGKDLPSDRNACLYRCAVFQVDQTPGDGFSVNSDPFFAPGSKPWEGPSCALTVGRRKMQWKGNGQADTQ
ncbi:unnamed protein product [Linum tenue]|uniref:Uncharacterized protein n=1 Tax=Linum tenue TaxID=586396 RepID=A0AAV0J5S2_9ROSI|nr:unnamed protein product [Linum tenue]